MKKITVKLSPDAKEVYFYLKQSRHKIDKSILKAIENKKEHIKADHRYGNPIQKRLIPNYYKEKYSITNLYRVELPSFWRMLYTIREGGTEIEIIAFVIDIVDHEKYNKRFRYKK
ncbi:MAG: hypothetical protein ABIE94_06710 [archaeon]